MTHTTITKEDFKALLEALPDADLDLTKPNQVAEAFRRLDLSANELSHVFEVDVRTIRRAMVGSKPLGPYMQTLLRAVLLNEHLPGSLPYVLDGQQFGEALREHKLTTGDFAKVSGVSKAEISQMIDRKSMNVPGTIATMVKWMDDGWKPSL